MKIHLAVFISIFLFFGNSNAQSVLLEENPAADTIRPERGQNLKKFSHLYIEFGLNIISNDPVVFTNSLKSSNLTIGYRFKRRFSNFYAFGYNLFINAQNFSIIQDETNKIFPNNITHDKEVLKYTNFGLELFNRFNFGKRGNIIGRYVDIGIYGNFSASIRHYTKDHFEIVNENNASTVEVTSSGLIYTNKFSYGANVRFGWNRFAVFGTYRLSDLFKETIDGYPLNYPELPRLSVGLEIGIY